MVNIEEIQLEAANYQLEKSIQEHQLQEKLITISHRVLVHFRRKCNLLSPLCTGHYRPES